MMDTGISVYCNVCFFKRRYLCIPSNIFSQNLHAEQIKFPFLSVITHIFQIYLCIPVLIETIQKVLTLFFNCLFSHTNGHLLDILKLDISSTQGGGWPGPSS